MKMLISQGLTAVLCALQWQVCTPRPVSSVVFVQARQGSGEAAAVARQGRSASLSGRREVLFLHFLPNAIGVKLQECKLGFKGAELGWAGLLGRFEGKRGFANVKVNRVFP